MNNIINFTNFYAMHNHNHFIETFVDLFKYGQTNDEFLENIEDAKRLVIDQIRYYNQLKQQFNLISPSFDKQLSDDLLAKIDSCITTLKLMHRSLMAMTARLIVKNVKRFISYAVVLNDKMMLLSDDIECTKSEYHHLLEQGVSSNQYSLQDLENLKQTLHLPETEISFINSLIEEIKTGKKTIWIEQNTEQRSVEDEKGKESNTSTHNAQENLTMEERLNQVKYQAGENYAKAVLEECLAYEKEKIEQELAALQTKDVLSTLEKIKLQSLCMQLKYLDEIKPYLKTSSQDGKRDFDLATIDELINNSIDKLIQVQTHPNTLVSQRRINRLNEHISRLQSKMANIENMQRRSTYIRFNIKYGLYKVGSYIKGSLDVAKDKKQTFDKDLHLIKKGLKHKIMKARHSHFVRNQEMMRILKNKLGYITDESLVKESKKRY